MYRIGEFSEKTGASAKTLRYYDSIGLLKPSCIDNFTNYRYYSDEQLIIYKRIEYLKKLGFTLEEIKNNINDLSISCLETKLEELKVKRDFIDFQISEIESLKSDIKNNKVMSLNR